MKIAIIGAGLAGLTLANRLVAHHQVTVLEKARGPGGRMSTRRAEPYAFDHGAQYFTAETLDFKAFIAGMRSRKLVADWPSEVVLVQGAKISSKPKYVATPGMNAICKTLAQDIDLRSQCHVETLLRSPQGWQIETRDGARMGPFDWVVSTAPSVQTAALLPDTFADRAALEQVQMQGCFALMLGFETSLALNWQAMKSGADPIGFMAVNSSKPSRNGSMSLLIQSSNPWAEQNLEAPLERIQTVLLESASRLADMDLSKAPHKVLHRWRYASTLQSAGLPYLFDADMRLAACGDWCLGGKVEAAFSSASALADTLQSLPKA